MYIYSMYIYIYVLGAGQAYGRIADAFVPATALRLLLLRLRAAMLPHPGGALGSHAGTLLGEPSWGGPGGALGGPWGSLGGALGGQVPL